MIWFGQKMNSYRFFGISLLKVKCKDNYLRLCFLGLPIYKKKTYLKDLNNRINTNKNFDMTAFDKEIEQMLPLFKSKSDYPDNRKIAFLATELYDTGGHTKCIREMIDAMLPFYKQSLFLTNIDSTIEYARKTLDRISQKTQVIGTNYNYLNFNSKLKKMFKQILRFNPKVLFVFIHPNDVFGTAILALIKKYTQIKIFYCPHASHVPNLGISFSDIVLEALPTSAYITQYLKKCPKTHISPMLSKAMEDCKVYSDSEILSKRKELGLKNEELCTMSGAAAYKFFYNDSSEYFETIKKLLERNQNVKHFLLSEFNDEQKAIIEKIFEDSSVRSRLIILPLSEEYELFFKCADVFIDSFPVSSALTMIDLMRLKVPYVVKINRENAHWSFHEYQKTDFPYMYEKASDLLMGVEKLLNDKKEAQRIVNENYEFYNTTYEANVCKEHLCELIDNADHIERYYSGSITGDYHFKELHV